MVDAVIVLLIAEPCALIGGVSSIMSACQLFGIRELCSRAALRHVRFGRHVRFTPEADIQPCDRNVR